MELDERQSIELERLELERKEIALKRKRLALEELKLDAEAQEASRHANQTARSADVVNLNVGGVHFDTTRTTLLYGEEGGYFRALLDGGLPSALDKEGRLFIDRDHRLFDKILQILRGCTDLDSITADQKPALALEARFYQLFELAARLEGGFNPFVLSKADQAIRARRNAVKAQLEDPSYPNDLGFDRTYLIDVFSAPVTFSGLPTSPQAGVIFAGKKRESMMPARGSSAISTATIGDFTERLNLFAGPFLEGLDLRGLGLVIAGGSIQRVLTEYGDPHSRRFQESMREESSDIDLFLVVAHGESADEAGVRAHQAILEHIATRLDIQGHVEGRDELSDGVPPFVMRNGGKILVVRSTNAITYVVGWPQRHLQLVLKAHCSVADVLLSFDLDSCQFAFDGSRVFGTPAALRSLETRMNIVDLDHITLLCSSSPVS